MFRKVCRHFGFTLVEVLLAVVIATVVLAAALGTFWRVAQTRQTLRYYSELAAHGRYGLNQIRDDLANLYRCRQPQHMRLLGLAGGQTTEADDRLIINVVSDQAQGRDDESPSDIFEVEYSLIYDQQSQSKCLTRRWAALEDPSSAREAGKLINIALYVRRLQFDYFDGRTWQRQWQQPGQLPRKVQVTLELGDDSYDKKPGLSISQVISLAMPPIEIAGAIGLRNDN